jgi:hypothetical protein
VADQAPRVLLAALAVACAVAGVGCGSDSEKATKTSETEARGVVERFGTATARRDYQTICDELLADNLVKKVEDVGLPCEIAFEKGVGSVKNPRIEVRQVKVQGNRALVSVRSTARGETPSDDAVQLVREGDEWRIASLVSPSQQGKKTSTTAATTSVPTPDHDDRDAAAERKKKRAERKKKRAERKKKRAERKRKRGGGGKD